MSGFLKIVALSYYFLPSFQPDTERQQTKIIQNIFDNGHQTNDPPPAVLSNDIL